MKKQFLLYFSVFAFLVIVYQFMNSKRMVERKNKEIKEQEARIEHLLSVKDSLINLNSETRCFTLVSNDKAREFYLNRGIDPDSLAKKIERVIISKNHPQEGNELVPYGSATGIMSINRIQVLNSRWIIAEFTDSVHWGEALIRYYIDAKGQLKLETMDGIIYSNTRH